METISKLKSVVALVILFSASVVYAAIIGEFAKAADLTWPLIFNGIVPVTVLGIFGWIGKRHLARQDEFHKEIIESKNNHAQRLESIETIHQLRGCDMPDSMVRGRRKEDKS